MISSAFPQRDSRMNDYLRATFFATANFVFVVSFVLVSAAQQSVAQSPTPKIPRLDRALYPQAYGVLGSENLMYPVDVSDWPVQITTEHQLFVDDYLVATCTHLTRQLHQAKRHGGPVLRLLGTPWEQASSGSLIVLRDENSGLFRMWYGIRSLVKAANGITYRGPTCYATSTDGIHWDKPNLGIFKFGQDTNNNICLPEGSIEGLFYDPAAIDPDQRYKAMVWHDPRGQERYAPQEGFYRYWSNDGVHWKGDNRQCLMPNGQGKNFPDQPCTGVGDATNFQWDAKLKKYVANTKILTSDSGRMVGRCESDDLIHWTRPRMVLFRDGLDDADSEMYEHQTFPHESLWIGQLRVMHGRKSFIPEPPIRDVRPGWKQVAIELTASRDGANWSRVCPGELILPLGAKGSWDADYLSPMTGQPLLVGDELWFYYLGAVRWERLKALGVPNPRDELNPGMANDEMHIGLAKLRRDGFVSLNAGEQPGMLVTRPLTFRSGKLYVNAEIANDGYLKVEVRNADGTAVEPYRLDACEAVIGDALKAPVSWAGESKLTCPKDQCQRLAFQLRKAKLYSFWIE